jgi:AmiR/NasT family two-component response regulator
MAEWCKRKIVIVEDEGLIAADLEARLKAAGYLVAGIADTGKAALDLVRKTSPDLVLMDIRIKGDTDGIEVAHRIREEFDSPVIYLTAYEDQETLERASATQAFGYIKKPIAAASLQGSIEMAISKHLHERELREQRDWAIASFAAVPEAVLVTEGSGLVCYLNSLAGELTGWTAEQALGQASAKVLRLFYPESGEPVGDLVPVALLRGEPVTLPPGAMLRSRTGRSYAIEGDIAPRRRAGLVEGAVVSFWDVTLDQFEAEQAHQDRKQGALLRLVGGIAEELRDARRAVAVADRLRALAETPELALKRVAIRELVAEWDAIGKQVAPDLTMRAQDPGGLAVQVDAQQLTKAVLNVLRHAQDRRKSATELVLDIVPAELEQLRQWTRIRITYVTADEDAATLERALEPSLRGHSEDLHATYLLIKKMGGLLTARVERRDTVTFEIYLPQVKAASAGAEIPDPSIGAAVKADGNSTPWDLLAFTRRPRGSV